MAGEAAIQIEKLDEQVDGLIDLNEKTQTVAELIAELNALQTQAVVPAFTGSLDAGFAQVTEAVKAQTAQSETSGADRKVAEVTIAGTLSDLKDLTERMLNALEEAGIRLAGPVEIGNTVAVSGSVTVANTPLLVDQVP